MKTIICLLFIATSLFAQTATNFFPTLTFNGETHSNCTISSVTTSHAIILWSGSGKKVKLSDLPESIQKQYGYDSKNAEQNAAAEEKSRAETLSKIQAQQQAQALSDSAVGETETVTVNKIGYGGHCTIRTKDGEMDVIIPNLPQTVRSYYSELEQAGKSAQSALAEAKEALTYSARQKAIADSLLYDNPNYESQNRAANLAEARYQELISKASELTADLHELASSRNQRVVISARPTGKVTGVNRFWDFIGMGTIETASTHRRSPQVRAPFR